MKIIDIAGDNRQVMDKSNGGDLFVDGVLRLRGHQFSPDLGAGCVGIQDAVGITCQPLTLPALNIGILAIMDG